jgi:hypothetical protein
MHLDIEAWLATVFWLIALSASAWYGWNAVAIFEPQQHKKARDQHVDELDYPRAWWWHQRWLNFLGALVGWLAFWFLGRKYVGYLVSACTATPNAWDIAAAVIAFVGMTGYLPGTIIPPLQSLTGLLKKVAEIVAALITKMTPPSERGGT